MDVTKIALWGPTGAGKTWLIHAFGRDLVRINSHINESAATIRWDLRLYDSDDEPIVSPIDLTIPPTGELEDEVITFVRRPFNKAGEPELSVPHVTHKIILRDNMGESLVKAMRLIPGVSDRPAELILSTADAVIVLLDVNYRAFVVSDPTMGILADDASYADHIQELCRLLSTGKRQKYVAVCASKVDLSSLKDGPMAVIRTLFPRTGEVLKQYNASKRLLISYFNISSFGYFRSRGKFSANFNPNTGAILDPESWQPHNVSSPFFWIFEQIEKNNTATQVSSPFRYPPSSSHTVPSGQPY